MFDPAQFDVAAWGEAVRYLAEVPYDVARPRLYTAHELFSGLELVDPPSSWAAYLDDDGQTGRFADIVRGAWTHYDWIDLTETGCRPGSAVSRMDRSQLLVETYCLHPVAQTEAHVKAMKECGGEDGLVRVPMAALEAILVME